MTESFSLWQNYLWLHFFQCINSSLEQSKQFLKELCCCVVGEWNLSESIVQQTAVIGLALAFHQLEFRGTNTRNNGFLNLLGWPTQIINSVDNSNFAQIHHYLAPSSPKTRSTSLYVALTIINSNDLNEFDCRVRQGKLLGSIQEKNSRTHTCFAKHLQRVPYG